MTIRNYTVPATIRESVADPGRYQVVGQCLSATVALTDTLEEAEQAKRAFENVLAPRFTRDEAIAIVKAARERHNIEDSSFALPEERADRDTGIRLALEALAAAGVFSDCGPEQCFSSESCARSMSDKLDAAGIR